MTVTLDYPDQAVRCTFSSSANQAVSVTATSASFLGNAMLMDESLYGGVGYTTFSATFDGFIDKRTLVNASTTYSVRVANQSDAALRQVTVQVYDASDAVAPDVVFSTYTASTTTGSSMPGKNYAVRLMSPPIPAGTNLAEGIPAGRRVRFKVTNNFGRPARVWVTGPDGSDNVNVPSVIVPAFTTSGWLANSGLDLPLGTTSHIRVDPEDTAIGSAIATIELVETPDAAVNCTFPRTPPQTTITYYFDPELDRLESPYLEQRVAFIEAVRNWSDPYSNGEASPVVLVYNAGSGQVRLWTYENGADDALGRGGLDCSAVPIQGNASLNRAYDGPGNAVSTPDMRRSVALQEVGHAIGLQHSRNVDPAMMSGGWVDPRWGATASYAVRQPLDEAYLRRQYRPE